MVVILQKIKLVQMKPGNHDVVGQAKVIDFKIQDGRPALKKKFKINQ